MDKATKLLHYLKDKMHLTDEDIDKYTKADNWEEFISEIDNDSVSEEAQTKTVLALIQTMWYAVTMRSIFEN